MNFVLLPHMAHRPNVILQKENVNVRDGTLKNSTVLLILFRRVDGCVYLSFGSKKGQISLIRTYIIEKYFVGKGFQLIFGLLQL